MKRIDIKQDFFNLLDKYFTQEQSDSIKNICMFLEDKYKEDFDKRDFNARYFQLSALLFNSSLSYTNFRLNLISKYFDPVYTAKAMYFEDCSQNQYAEIEAQLTDICKGVFTKHYNNDGNKKPYDAGFIKLIDNTTKHKEFKRLYGNEDAASNIFTIISGQIAKACAYTIFINNKIKHEVELYEDFYELAGLLYDEEHTIKKVTLFREKVDNTKGNCNITIKSSELIQRLQKSIIKECLLRECPLPFKADSKKQLKDLQRELLAHIDAKKALIATSASIIILRIAKVFIYNEVLTEISKSKETEILSESGENIKISAPILRVMYDIITSIERYWGINLNFLKKRGHDDDIDANEDVIKGKLRAKIKDYYGYDDIKNFRSDYEISRKTF